MLREVESRLAAAFTTDHHGDRSWAAARSALGELNDKSVEVNRP
jgi:hypothetical protein